MLRIFLTIAISVATCERSFSKLKLIKNYIRSTMSSLRMRNLAILSIERQLTNEIDFNNVIDKFANRKAGNVFCGNRLSSSSSSFKRYTLQVRHKQDWGRRSVLLLTQAAVLPESGAGSDVTKPASSFVIQNRQTSCSM